MLIGGLGVCLSLRFSCTKKIHVESVLKVLYNIHMVKLGFCTVYTLWYMVKFMVIRRFVYNLRYRFS